MVKFVHTADIHLDTPFSARFTPEQASLRRKEVMQTFERICDEAKQADLFLISGDLFDGRFVAPETVAFLKRCFSQMPHTKVFIAAGNHDPMSRDSVYATEPLGENVHVFQTEMEYVDLPELQVRVHGCSFQESHQEKSLLTSLARKEDWCNLLVLHGEVVSSDGESVYNPIEKQKLWETGVEYAALGHIHLYQEIDRRGTVYYAYPGIPEGRGFDEDGARGYIAGEAEKGSLKAEWKEVSKRKFIRKELDISDCADSVELISCIEKGIEEDGREHSYRIILTGTAKDSLIQTEVLAEQLKGKAFYIELKNQTKPSYQTEELAKEPSLRGAFVAAMLKEIEKLPTEEKEMGQLALQIGLRAIEKGVQS